eukprot:1633928-Rhodomonas_salina.2
MHALTCGSCDTRVRHLCSRGSIPGSGWHRTAHLLRDAPRGADIMMDGSAPLAGLRPRVRLPSRLLQGSISSMLCFSAICGPDGSYGGTVGCSPSGQQASLGGGSKYPQRGKTVGSVCSRKAVALQNE